MRLALDLGLHMDMTLHVTEGILSQAEAELRGEVFWGAYIIDQYVFSEKNVGDGR